MQLYEVSLIEVETMDWLISKYPKKCLEVLNSLTNVALYSSTKLKFPTLSFVKEYKLGKTSRFQMQRDTQDPLVKMPSLP